MRQEEKVMNLEELKVVDADVAAAIEAEIDRQNSHIELIASENCGSDSVMEGQGCFVRPRGTVARHCRCGPLKNPPEHSLKNAFTFIGNPRSVSAKTPLRFP